MCRSPARNDSHSGERVCTIWRKKGPSPGERAFSIWRQKGSAFGPLLIPADGRRVVGASQHRQGDDPAGADIEPDFAETPSRGSPDYDSDLGEKNASLWRQKESTSGPDLRSDCGRGRVDVLATRVSIL